MKPKIETLIGSLLLASCLQPAPIKTKLHAPAQQKPEETLTVRKIDPPVEYRANAPEDVYTPPCPEGMADIENKYCIDQYEASIVDRITGKEASPHYIPSQEGTYDADWQYHIFNDKEIDQTIIPQLLIEGQSPSMPPREAEQFSSFQPKAVSHPNRIPASYVTKIIAEQACANAGKRLCSRKEWYKACVGPNGLSPYLNKKGEEIFPETYPYGQTYQKGKCNLGLQANRWPPGLLGRKNNQEMLDPRIGRLLGKDGLPMKKTTDSLPECTNGHGVYNMLGNVHEIVSDIHIAARFPKERVTFVGSHYARSATQSCAEATTDHWQHYTDYSIGFRCCKDIQEYTKNP